MKPLVFLIAMVGLSTGCIPVVRTSVVHYGVEARVIDADTGKPIEKYVIKVKVDSRQFDKRTNRSGHFSVAPQKHRYCAWLMGGPVFMNPFKATIELLVEGYIPYRRESIVVPLDGEGSAPDKDRLVNGSIRLGDVAVRKL